MPDYSQTNRRCPDCGETLYEDEHFRDVCPEHGVVLG